MGKGQLIAINKRNFWLFQISGWLIYGILFLVYDRISYNTEVTYKHFISWFLIWIIGLILTLALRQLYKQCYFRSKSIFVYVLVSILASVVVAVIWISIREFTLVSFDLLDKSDAVWNLWSKPRFFNRLWSRMIISSCVLLIWSFFYFGFKLLNDLVVQQRRNQDILLSVKESQLRMLKYQLNPHFLFNSLNSVQALMYINTPLADEILTEFSEFLRYSLKFKDDIYVPLEDEFDMISKYLFIEKIRFQDKLSYKIDLSDETRKSKILSFLLQPLVENAIKHGLKFKQDTLNIRIQSIKLDDYLVITIENSGRWADPETNQGIGIENVRDRLKTAYPEYHKFEIKEEKDWVRIKLQLTI